MDPRQAENGMMVGGVAAMEGSSGYVSCFLHFHVSRRVQFSALAHDCLDHPAVAGRSFGTSESPQWTAVWLRGAESSPQSNVWRCPCFRLDNGHMNYKPGSQEGALQVR